MDQPTDVHQADVPQPKETQERIPLDEPWSRCVGAGWQRELVDPLLTMIRHAPQGVFIAQIKEKFGTLRLYVDGPEWIGKICEALEHLSAYMCEDCGARNGFTYGGGPHMLKDADGKWLAKQVTRNTDGGWVRTLCVECRQVGIETEKAREAAYKARRALKKESE